MAEANRQYSGAVHGLNFYAKTHHIGEDTSYFFLIILSPKHRIMRMKHTGRYVQIHYHYTVLLKYYDVLLLDILA